MLTVKRLICKFKVRKLSITHVYAFLDEACGMSMVILKPKDSVSIAFCRVLQNIWSYYYEENASRSRVSHSFLGRRAC